MTSWFEEINLWAYYSVCGAFYDIVIWCLGPFVDDTREYGLLRCYLALMTRSACRVWLLRPE